jgi:hypothetical protein
METETPEPAPPSRTLYVVIALAVLADIAFAPIVARVVVVAGCALLLHKTWKLAVASSRALRLANATHRDAFRCWKLAQQVDAETTKRLREAQRQMEQA